MSETTEAESTKDPRRIRQGNWEQGAIISPTDLAALEIGLSGPCGVLLSQSCDVLALSYDDEPVVEIITCVPVERADSRYVKLRNPRVVHLPVDVDGAPVYHEFRAHDRFLVPRHLLETISRDPTRTLPPESLRMLQTWVIERYLRPAFPDEFNVRLKKGKRALDRLFSRASDVTGVWILLDTQNELGADQPYTILNAVATMRTDVYADRARRQQVEQFITQLGNILDGCAGVVCENFQVLPEARFSLDDLAVYQRLDKSDASIP